MIGNRLLTLLIGFATAMIAGVLLHVQAFAATQTVNVFPNYDTSIGTWDQKSGGSDFWGRIHRQTSGHVDGSWICSDNNNSQAIYGAGATENPGGTASPMPNIQQGVTAIGAEVSGKSGFKVLDFTHPKVRLDILVNSGVVATGDSPTWTSAGGFLVTATCSNSGPWSGWLTSTTPTVNFSAGNELTQADVNSLQFSLNRTQNTTRAVRVNSMYATLTYVTYSTLTQNGYRFYQNANSATPGAAIGASATTPIDVNKDTASPNVRLRMSIQSTAERWLRQYGNYKLQYALKGTGTCAAPTGSWGDVQAGSGAIRWYDNTGVADGAPIANVSGQPAGTMLPQRYEESNPIAKSQQVTINNFGIWDFSLTINTATADYGNTYCFRIVSDTGTQPINTYTNYPELRITGDLGMSFVNSAGTPIATPSVPFSGLASMGSCQTSTGTLGVNDARIRVTDNRPVGNWTLALAATGGGSAKWTSGANQYSFNDSAGSPAGCTNGQLSVDLSAINAAPKSGCTGTGLAGGSNTSFTGASPVSIGSGTATDRFCYWDVTSVGLSQQVPPYTPPGSYTLGTTLTITAV